MNIKVILTISAALLSFGCVTVTQAAVSAAPVHMGQAQVAGHQVAVLVAANGHTLYYFTHDTHGSATCSGSCAKLWPPLLSSGPIDAHVPGIPGVFQTIVGANGKQVDYNGHPLYAYAPDTRVGDALGNGLFGGTWWVATPKLKMQAISETPSTAKPINSSGW